jgi:hypothetical protein
LLIGPDHEDDITNQGSDDAGVPNLLILGPNYEDEDGDNENHSSSVYLNFNQDDARNVEHEGDENEEDEGVTPPGLIGLIAYLYHQVATSFPEAHLQRTLGLSVLGLEQFNDG